MDNNAAERALRDVAVSRKNYSFAGSDTGGERAAVIYTLIESAKLGGLNPHAWLTDVLARIADHPARRISDLMPWNWSPRTAQGGTQARALGRSPEDHPRRGRAHRHAALHRAVQHPTGPPAPGHSGRYGLNRLTPGRNPHRRGGLGRAGCRRLRRRTARRQDGSTPGGAGRLCPQDVQLHLRLPRQLHLHCKAGEGRTRSRRCANLLLLEAIGRCPPETAVARQITSNSPIFWPIRTTRRMRQRCAGAAAPPIQTAQTSSAWKTPSTVYATCIQVAY